MDAGSIMLPEDRAYLSIELILVLVIIYGSKPLVGSSQAVSSEQLVKLIPQL